MADALDRSLRPAEDSEPSRRQATAALLRTIGADPRHLSEHLVLFAVERLGPPAHRWADGVEADESSSGYARVIDGLRQESIVYSRINGALSGSPLFIALVPAYVSVLWEQARMALRIAALGGHDPTAPERAAELLVDTGVHPDIASADAALSDLDARTRHRGPGSKRDLGGLLGRIELIENVLVLAGFVAPPGKDKPSRAHRALKLAVSAAVWAVTWIVPVTFMLLMAWTCEGRTRQLFDRAMSRYWNEASERGTWHRAMVEWHKQQPWRVLALALGALGPLAAVAYVAQAGTGPSLLRFVVAQLGLVLVLVLAGLAARY